MFIWNLALFYALLSFGAYDTWMLELASFWVAERYIHSAIHCFISPCGSLE